MIRDLKAHASSGQSGPTKGMRTFGLKLDSPLDEITGTGRSLDESFTGATESSKASKVTKGEKEGEEPVQIEEGKRREMLRQMSNRENLLVLHIYESLAQGEAMPPEREKDMHGFIIVTTAARKLLYAEACLEKNAGNRTALLLGEHDLQNMSSMVYQSLRANGGIGSVGQHG